MALFMIVVMAIEFTVTASRHVPFSPDCLNASAGAVTIERQFIDTAVRLTGGCNNHSGELQIKYLNQDWRSVCYDGFDYFDAQFACSFLGFPFIASIYEISAPANSQGFEYSCTGKNLADGATRISACSSFQTHTPCSSYAGVVCDTNHSPLNGYVAIAVYSYGTRFDIIAPNGGVFFDDCYVAQYGYCHGVYFGSRNNTQLDTLVSLLSQPPQSVDEVKYCGSHGSIANFGITCIPIPGDPVLTVLTEGQDLINREGLVWYYDEVVEWVNVCGNAMGYIEAQVLCNSLDFPYFTFLQMSHRPTNSPKVISSIECSGHEKRLADCHIELVNTSDIQCASLSAVGCGGSLMGSINDRAIVIFDAPPSGETVAPFTVIAPMRGLYMTNCSVVILDMDHYCPGVHTIEGNNSGLQSAYLDPSNCQGVQYQLFGLQCAPTTDSPDSVPATTVTVTEDNSSAYVLVVSLSVCGVLVAIIGLVACVGLWIGCKHTRLKKMDEARRKIIKDLEDRNSSVVSTKSFNGDFRIRKCHKPITRRKSSGTHHRIDNVSWEVPLECITLGEELGSGAYGTIQKGVIDCCHQNEPIDVAVKLLKKYASESERRSLVQEIDMMKDIGYHRHVVCMLACCTQGSMIALVMEFMPCGNLQTFLKKHRDPEIQEPVTGGSLAIPNPYIMGENSISISDGEHLFKNESKKAKHTLSLITQLQFARQITLGMEYLSGMKIVHRDLATRNVLIDEEMFLKVSDFGLSRDIYSDSAYHMAHNKDRLPVRWMAMESIIDRDFSVASDVWSFGVVLWEIMTCGSFPYYHMTNSEVIEGIKGGYKLSKPDSCPEEVYEIMSTCWQKVPSQRPSFTDLRGMLDSLLDKGEYTSLM